MHTQKKIYQKLLLPLIISLGLNACTHKHKKYLHDGPPPFPVNVSKIKDAEPKIEPRSKYGNPESYNVLGHTYHVSSSAKGYHERGIASWYGMKFHGQLTSNREVYDILKMTGASRTLPLPTYVEITNLENGKKGIIKINDRGPFSKMNRIVDVTYAAAKKLGFAEKGSALVDVKAIDPEEWSRKKHHQFMEEIQPAPVIENNLPIITSKPLLYVQIGAFINKDNAESIKEKINNLLLSTIVSSRIKEVEQNNKIIYKVQVGPLDDIKQADMVHSELWEKGYHGITVVE